MKRKKIIYLLTFLSLGVFKAKTAYAVCPICTIAVGAGLGLSRWLGIDDSISGVWIGGLTVSMIIWTIDWLERKNIKFKLRNSLTVLTYYAAILIPLYLKGIIGDPQNTFCGCGIDKLLLGIIGGSLAFYMANSWHDDLKSKNNNHAYFPFQKVIMPVSALIIFSIIFYYLTKI